MVLILHPVMCSLRQTKEKIIDVDTLGFLSVENLGKIIEADDKVGYCHGCFTNEYPTELPKPYEKSKYEYKISERKRG